VRIDKIIDSTTGCEMMAMLDFFPDTIKYGSAKRMKRRPASSPPSAPYVISECPKVFTMPGQDYVE
jgi:hypothetical protein